MSESQAIAPSRGAGFDERGLRTVTRLRPEDWLNTANPDGDPNQLNLFEY